VPAAAGRRFLVEAGVLTPQSQSPDRTAAREPSAAQLERRLTLRLEGYWLSLRWSGAGPFFHDFRPERNPIPWSDCFLAWRADGGGELALDHVGARLATLLKPAGSNLAEPEWLPQALALCFGDLEAALAGALPVRREASFRRRDGSTLLYRSILLPFVDWDRQPRYLLGGLTYRLDPEPAREAPNAAAVVVPLWRRKPRLD